MPAKGNKSKTYSLKICPECSTRLAVDAKRCFSCHAKVGRVDAGGRAKRPFNWLAYITCFFSWSGLFLYIWWAFLRQ